MVHRTYAVTKTKKKCMGVHMIRIEYLMLVKYICTCMYRHSYFFLYLFRTEIVVFKVIDLIPHIYTYNRMNVMFTGVMLRLSVEDTQIGLRRCRFCLEHFFFRFFLWFLLGFTCSFFFWMFFLFCFKPYDCCCLFLFLDFNFYF